ncbi:MAG: GNAT family N-acetyltransferase [Steroidobacteraceae bacterium]
MHIQFYTHEYLETVTDLMLDMSAHYNGPNASERHEVRQNLIKNILGEHSGVHLVIALDGVRAVGLASISILYPAPKERGQLFMKELFVASDCRGGGIGKALMHFVARYAVSKSCSRFDWTVDETNLEALSFYRQLGAQTNPGKLYFRLAGPELDHFASES